MKTFVFILLFLSFYNGFSQEIQEKNITTKVNEVTVFIKDAQITRKKTINISSGETILKFINLSPFINAKSIQIKANANITVLSVNHQQNFLDKLEKPQELVDIENKLKGIEDKIQLENTYLSILNEEISFLQDNRTIGGKNEELSVNTLREASNYYGTKLTDLKLKQIDRLKNIENLKDSQTDLINQQNTLTSKKKFPNGEILVKVKSKNATTSDFELSYMVSNAGWLPNYDIRAKNVNDPIVITYKASVKQDTKVDWDNVKLNLSSANPNLSGVAPELKTYYLDYNSIPPRYNILDSNEITGIVMDKSNTPLPGASVMIKGTTIGTQTDFDGRFSLATPNFSSPLVFSYLGYKTKELPISNNITVMLEEDVSMLEEVVIVGYGTNQKRAVTGKLEGKFQGIKIKKATNSIIPSLQIAKQTTVDFNIKIPYTVKSNNKNYSVDIVNHELPAEYTYYSVPKIDKDAFLIAGISDWEKYNFLEGEANIFFEDTYVGKTILDIRYASDTLNISLGRDKNVVIKREKIKDFTTKQFIGSKKEEFRGWDISIKNNKSEPINLLVFDQIPVSTLEEIEVKPLELTKGIHNTETGEIKWDFNLKPRETKKINLQYSVRYPKHKSLIIE
ncbi:mucoidy inhibitor MuiA family protein [Gaetbulibacter saemankumensis]|uniref:mucoidy inhibitor MuiA family protein n=1 Tax=Gaetbulibacter saemankumensis TaxID=311208 RepID=UPI00042831D3|nr:mucoidy inhibitor MuiA family protein [Gaetbulibacter saemankumensis]